MRLIIIFTISILFANFSYSQDMENVNTDEFMPTEVTPFQQTQTAIQQLRNKIKTEVKYPEYLIDSGIEGTSIVAFSIDTNGEIKEKKITKSLGSSFDRIILEASKELKLIKLSRDLYKGETKIFIPIRFTK